MTRKDYELIAAAILDSKPIGLSEIGIAQKRQWVLTAHRIATALSAENSRFDSARFLHSCGVDPISE